MSAEKYGARGVTKPLHYRRTTCLHELMKMAAMPLLFLLLTAAVRGQSALDGFDPNANGIVRVVVVQPDGKILVGGDFTTLSPNGGAAVTRNHIARLNPDGTLDTAFNPNANGFVHAIALQADGKILVGGRFNGVNCIGGQTRNFFARLDATTGLADSLNVGPNAPVNAITVQADGKILVGGQFDVIGGFQRPLIARLDPTTGVADSFNPNPNVVVTSIAVQADGKALAGGNFTTLAPNGGAAVTRNRIARLETKPSTLGNISTRVRIQTGDNAMIGGFIITGTQPQTVIVRGIGPSLPVPGALADPVIEVHGSAGKLLATDDNWRDAATRQQIIDSGLAPTNDLESALWGILNPGAYTVVVRGKNDGSGIGLFEVYDLNRAADSKLANVSTRGFVGTGDNLMIGGAIIIGSAPARVLLRAIGPSLTNFGVPNALGDPILELYDGNGGLIAVNYDWRDDQEAEIIATGIPPSNNLESAIVRNLAPGAYTAIVRGVNSTIGIAVFEAYGLN